MFRKIAIALVAASALTAPGLAKNAPLGNGTGSQTAQAPVANTVTPDKAAKADKAVKKHRVVRHHHHGPKMAKHFKHIKYARSATHGKTAAKLTSGAQASAKHVSSKPAAKSGVDAKSGVN